MKLYTLARVYTTCGRAAEISRKRLACWIGTVVLLYQRAKLTCETHTRNADLIKKQSFEVLSVALRNWRIAKFYPAMCYRAAIVRMTLVRRNDLIEVDIGVFFYIGVPIKKSPLQQQALMASSVINTREF